MKKLMKLFIVILLAMGVSMLPPSITGGNEIVAKAETVKLDGVMIFYIGEKSPVSITNTTGKMTWKSSDSKIAKITKSGTLTGIKKGTVTITATQGTTNYTFKVKVIEQKISHSKVILDIAETTYVSVEGSQTDVTWTSSNKKVATVNKNGFVYAMGKGQTTITGTYKGKKYKSVVTVKDKDLHASTTSLVISKDTQIMISSKGLGETDTIGFDIDNPDIITGEWGEWVGDTLPLNIYVNDIGSTKITITATNTKEKIEIDVTTVSSKRPTSKALSAEKIYEISSVATAQVNTNDGLGSGFFISSGVLVTNYHVIEGASNINLQLHNGKKYDVQYILGYSKALDIAILSIPVETDYISISPYALKSGETVYTLGSSLGFNDTFTNGIISNTSRILEDGVDYIQTNAAIARGNSGGPLINSYGEVVGINTLAYNGGQNLNFAINLYQVYQVDTSTPITVKQYYNSLPKVEEEETDTTDVIYEDESKSALRENSQLVKMDTMVWGSASSTKMDYYTFTIEENKTVRLVGINVYQDNESTSYLEFGIYDLNGELLVISEDIYSGQTLGKVGIISLEKGTYYIGVKTKANITMPISYGFVLYND